MKNNIILSGDNGGWKWLRMRRMSGADRLCCEMLAVGDIQLIGSGLGVNEGCVFLMMFF